MLITPIKPGRGGIPLCASFRKQRCCVSFLLSQSDPLPTQQIMNNSYHITSHHTHIPSLFHAYGRGWILLQKNLKKKRVNKYINYRLIIAKILTQRAKLLLGLLGKLKSSKYQNIESNFTPLYYSVLFLSSLVEQRFFIARLHSDFPSCAGDHHTPK